MTSYAERVIEEIYKDAKAPRLTVTNKGLRDIDEKIARGLKENEKMRLPSEETNVARLAARVALLKAELEMPKQQLPKEDK